ncbi:MAG TPA: hypothetical protein IAB42_02460 [Candidatus Coproplasma avistercoris]|nr:hypothetical protein [Candidatus Coproplasma avistercoris]
MNVQKRNRLIAAGTVSVVLLLVILVAILIYQLVVIVNLSNRKEQLQEEYDRIIQDIGETEDKLDYYSDLNNLFDLALEKDLLGR